MGNRRFRLMASNPLSRPSKDTAPALAELQANYGRRSPIPARFRDMSWSSWFRINSRMVARLKVGRLLLGGDAAHIHSPAVHSGHEHGHPGHAQPGLEAGPGAQGAGAPRVARHVRAGAAARDSRRAGPHRGADERDCLRGAVRPLDSRSRDGSGHHRYADVPACDRLSGQSALRHLLAGGATCRRPRAGPAGAMSQRRWRLAGRKGHCSACSIRPGSRSWPCVPQSRQRPLPVCPMPCSRGALSLALSSWRLRKRPASDSTQFSAGQTAYSWCAGWLCRFRQRRAGMDSAA